MIIPVLVGGALFFACIAVGCAMDLWAAWRPRVHLARAFAHGRAEHIARIPAPVEPLPDLTRKDAA